MRGLVAIAIFVILLTPSGEASAGPEESIVAITVDLAGKARSFGSGFLISGDGRVLTAYHNVVGARSITVFHRGQGYSNIVVEAIGPDVDLAVLRIIGLPAEVPYLRLVELPPPAAAREELRAFGHAAGILDQEFHTRMTRPPFVKSREFTTPRGYPLFARPDLDLITVNLTIFNGLSGGPIVSSYGVLGVVSGSLVEGGSIAWAIPSKYARAPYLRPVNRRPAEVDWTDFNLITSSQNLRSRILMDEGLAAVIGRYFDSVEALRAGHDRLIPMTMAAIVSIDAAVAALDGVASNRGSDSAVLQYVTGLFEARDKEINASLMEDATAQSNLNSQLLEVNKQIEGLPRTPRNVERIRHMDELIQEIARQMEQPRSHMKLLYDAKLNLIARMFAAGTDLADKRAVMLDFRDYLYKVKSPETIRQLQAQVAAYRSFGRAVEDLLNQPLDDWRSSWTFTSPNGFLLRFPGGWETGDRFKPEFRTALSSKLGTTLLLEDIFPNWDGRVPGQDAPNMALVLSVVRPPALDLSDDDIVTAFVEGVRRNLRNLTSVRWQRRAIKSRLSVIVESIARDANGDFTHFQVLVPAGQRTVLFDFEMASNLAAGNWPKCLGVVESLQLN